MQVAAFGKQDVDTIIKPNLTFFKTVYKASKPVFFPELAAACVRPVCVRCSRCQTLPV